MGKVTTSIVVEISSPTDSEVDSRCEVEVDSREDGLNGGKTTFYAGDNIALLLYKSSNVTITKVTCTSGYCVAGSTGTTEEEEFLTLSNSDSTSTSKPASSISVSVITGSANIISTLYGNIKADEASVAVLRATYTAPYTVYTLRGFPATLAGESSYPIVVYFQGVAT